MPTELLHDIRTAARHLWRARAFTTFAIALLALGTGATTAIFSILDALVLREPPYSGPTRLVAYRSINSAKALSTPALSASDFRDHHQRAKSFTNLAAFRPDFASCAPNGGEPTPFVSAMVTGDFSASSRLHRCVAAPSMPESSDRPPRAQWCSAKRAGTGISTGAMTSSDV